MRIGIALSLRSAPTGRQRIGPCSGRAMSEVKVGDLVRPARRGGSPWRLGLVEAKLDDGRFHVRSYVAPPGSYEGSVAAYAADELVVVAVERVVGRLLTLRAEVASKLEEIGQVEKALAATGRELK